jgi:molybdopterin synthase sulfur carrier subunit
MEKRAVVSIGNLLTFSSKFRTVSAVRIKVRYFARYRSLVGKSEEELEVPNGITVKELIEILKERYPALREEVFAEDDDLADVNVSRNGRYVSFDEVLRDGDVVAIFPPVSGG